MLYFQISDNVTGIWIIFMKVLEFGVFRTGIKGAGGKFGSASLRPTG